MKYILFLFLFLVKFSSVSAEIIKSISVNGNERITDETIIVFSNVEIGDDLIKNDLNKIISNLYETDFFKDVSVFLKNNILNISVEENYLVQSVEINGVKNKSCLYSNPVPSVKFVTVFSKPEVLKKSLLALDKLILNDLSL